MNAIERTLRRLGFAVRDGRWFLGEIVVTPGPRDDGFIRRRQWLRYFVTASEMSRFIKLAIKTHPV